MKYAINFMALLFILSLICCQTGKNSIRCDAGSENFDTFYRGFHQDSLFQLSRIIFPLKGIKRTGDENPEKVSSEYYWEKKEWVIQRYTTIDTSIYKEEFIRNDTMVEHLIFIPNSGFSIKRQFRLIHCNWFLTYYSEIDL